MKILDFLKDKIADKMNKEALERKVDELMDKNIVINDIDLVSEDYKRLAQERFKDAYKQLEKDAKLTKFDKFMRIMGFDTKNLKKLKDSQDTFLKDKGLELFKEDNKEIFTDSRAKLKKYIEAYKKKSLKTLSGKRFWISLGVNLFMVTASCYALNWAHPRVKELIDLFRDKKADKNANVEKKDEVKSC